MQIYNNNSKSIGEHISDTFQVILRREGEITAQKECNKFFDEYSTVTQQAQQNVTVKENSQGLRSAYINDSGTDLETPKIGDLNGQMYTQGMSTEWEKKAKQALESTSNPYARKLINDKLQSHLQGEKVRWNKFESELLEKDSFNSLEGIIEGAGHNVTLDSYQDSVAEVSQIIGNASINPIKKLDLVKKAPLYLAQSLMEKMSFETPMDLLNLYKEDKDHFLFKAANPHEVHKYINQAKRNYKSANQIKGIALEVEKKAKIAMLEKYGQIDEAYFTELHDIYSNLGEAKKAFQLEKDVQRAGIYYKASTWLEQFDFEHAPEAIEELKPSKGDSKDFSMKYEIYEKLKSEYQALKNGYETDPAKFADKELMESDNYTAQLDDTISIYDKRYIQQESRGVVNPRVLTNSEKGRYAQLLLNKTDDEMGQYLGGLNNLFGNKSQDAFIEISSSNKVDDMLRMVLHTHAYKGSDNFDYMLDVRRRSLSGDLDAKNFVDQKELGALESLVWSGEEVDSLLKHFTPQKQQFMKRFLHEGSKAIYKDSGEKTSIDDSIKETLSEFFDCVYNTTDDHVIPKFYKGISGQIELTSHETKKVSDTLHRYSNPALSKDYWSVDKMSSIFGQVKSKVKLQQKNNMNVAKDIVKNGQWILKNDNSGYVYKMTHGNNVFYDVDNRGELKVFTIKELVESPIIESQVKVPSFADIAKQGIFHPNLGY